MFLLLSYTLISFSQENKQQFVSSDITNFWKAYEKITATTDVKLQYNYINDLFINKASAGLKSMMAVRNYTDTDYVAAINKYPEFWNSIKKNTLNIQQHYPEIESALSKLKKSYINFKPATIYFTIGVFRSGGTAEEDRVLIGSELSLADKAVVSEELPEWLQTFFNSYTPINDIALLCTHEYIHTMQNEGVDNLLCNALREGVAEFLSCLVTERASNTPSFSFGKKNEAAVRQKFIEDLFLPERLYNWMWGENKNEFKERDLGYYIGYRICEEYYNKAANKENAIKELIELDYTNDSDVEMLIDNSGFFSKSISTINDEYEKQRPEVIAVSPFNNGSENVPPRLTKITITFSEPLNGKHTGVDFGPLGEEAFPKLSANRIWSDDKRSWTIEADLKPGMHYQVLISNNFRKENAVRLKSYLLDFKTSK